MKSSKFSLSKRAKEEKKLEMPFPGSYKKSLKDGTKNTTHRIGDECGKYKVDSVYTATSYSGKSWNIDIKVVSIKTIKAKDAPKAGEIKELSPDDKVDVIKFEIVD